MRLLPRLSELIRLPAHPESRAKRFLRIRDLLVRCAYILTQPLVPVIVIVGFWFITNVGIGMHAPAEKNEDMRKIADDAGIMYTLLYTAMFITVVEKYMGMRKAIDRIDIDDYASHCEPLSVLLYVVVGVLSLFIMLGKFLVDPGDHVFWGALAICCPAYLLSLLFTIMREVDDPRYGILHIKNIPKQLLDLDVRNYREKRRAELLSAKKDVLKEFCIRVSVEAYAPESNGTNGTNGSSRTNSPDTLEIPVYRS